jgi:hypothetical protein
LRYFTGKMSRTVSRKRQKSALWVLEAGRDKIKETTVGQKVAYYIYKHFRSVSEHI